MSDAHPPTLLPVVTGTHLDITVTFQPPPLASSSSAAAAATTAGNASNGDAKGPAHSAGAAAAKGPARSAGAAAAGVQAEAISIQQPQQQQPQQQQRRLKWPSAAAAVVGPAVGVILKSWRAEGCGAAVVVFSWVTQRLEVHFDEVCVGGLWWGAHLLCCSGVAFHGGCFFLGGG